MEGQIKSTCYRIFGLLLLIIMFTMQAQASVEAQAFAGASLPAKQSIDIADALEQSRIEMMETMNTYNVGYQARLLLEDATLFEMGNSSETQIAQAPAVEVPQAN